MSELAGPVSAAYLGGVLDRVGSVRYHFHETSRASGYRLVADLAIRTSTVSGLAGLLDEVLGANDITYGFGESGIVELTEPDAIRTLWNHVEGYLVDNAPEFAFLARELAPRLASDEDASVEGMVGLVKAINELNPEWAEMPSKRYTASFFDDRYDVDVDRVSAVTTPRPAYPDRLSDTYVAGLMDSHRSFFLRVGRNTDYDLDYSMSPQVYWTVFQPSELFLGRLRTYFEERDLNARLGYPDDQLSVRITTVDGVDRMIELVQDDLWLTFPLAQFFYEQVVPAYRNGYHRTKHGFVDVLGSYEAMASDVHGGFNEGRELDAAHFRALWAEELAD